MTPSLIISLALVAGAPAPKETPKPELKIEGVWVVEKYEGPKETPPGSVTVTITADRILIREPMREKPEEAAYTADLKKKPATIDIRPGRAGGPPGGPPPDLVVKGIVDVDGDVLKLCFAREGERPTEFKGDAEKGVMFIILKRVKVEK
jgi:uncharacterized protein (TIGR03067 family)